VSTNGSLDGAVGPLREALMVCGAAGMSGVLRVTGDPGGAVHLAHGLVIGLATPGAPGPESLLLRSGRVSDADWEDAFSAAAALGRPMGVELVARELVGAGELEALLRVALADAVFVLASGTIAEYRSEPGHVEAVLPLEPGEDPSWLLAEAVRRIRVLESLAGGTDPGRVKAAPGVLPSGVAAGAQARIVAVADGRRTARDIAFATGSGVFATRLQLARMEQARLLVPETAGDTRALAEVRPAQPLPSRERRLMPWRSRDAPLPARRNGASEPRMPLGLLRPRSAREAGPGTAS
jgi:hypothetical protein